GTYFQHTDTSVRLQFMKRAGDRNTRIRPSDDEYGAQFRIWGLLAQLLTMDELRDPKRRERVWNTLLWIRVIFKLGRMSSYKPAVQAKIDTAKAELGKITTMLSASASEADLKTQIDKVTALYEEIDRVIKNPNDGNGVAAADAPNFSKSDVTLWT